MRMKKLLIFKILAVIVLTVSACSKGHTPRMEGPQTSFKSELKRSSPDFQQGWKDGCEVGSDSGTKSFYKLFTRINKVDGYKMASSPDYKTAWNYAFWYCYRDDYVDHKSTGYGSFLRGWQ